MSQERSSKAAIFASLSISALAYAGGLWAMASTQNAIARTQPLRLVLSLSEAALALPALVAAALLASRFPELYRFEALRPWAALRTVALGLAFWALSLGVFEAQYVFVKPPLSYLEQFQGLHDLLKPRTPFDLILSIGAIALAPAICEEILFRGLLTPVLRRAVGTTVAIAVSAALFGLIHVDSMPNGAAAPTLVYYRVPFAFVLGLLLGKLRLDTGSLWPPIIAHATLNATTFLVVLLVEEPRGVLPDPQPLVALSMLVVGSAAARWLMRQIRPALASPALTA